MNEEIIQWAVDKRKYYDYPAAPEAMEKFFSRNDTVREIKCPVETCEMA